MKQVEIDIILLSYAQNRALQLLTENAIQSLMASEDPDLIRFNIIVIESEKSLAPFQYPNSQTVYPDSPFGYHHYMNIGVQLGHAKFVCMCNNDLIFHEKWATEMLKPFKQFIDAYSASPICSKTHLELGYKLNDGFKLGYRVREELAGWCIFVKRDLFDIIGKLDENVRFWFADNDYGNTLFVRNIPHILVTSSIVDHLESKTLNEQTEEKRLELTEKEQVYVEKKWNPRLGEGWQLM